MVSDPKIVQYVEELDLLIIADGEKLYHITGDVIAGMWKAYAEGHGIDYDICEGCECVDPKAGDLISKQALLYALDDTELTDDGGVDINDLEDLLKRMPTVEAVPLEDYRSMEQTVHKLTQAIAEPRVVTNADNLRSIQNDMQLAIFMDSVNACPYDRDDALFECEKWNGACDRCWLYWLKQKVEDEVEE